jgi:hypothetical protein
VFTKGWGCVRFRRVLWGETARLWRELQDLCSKVSLIDGTDRCIWLLEKNGKFIVKFIYTALKMKQTVCEFKDFWVVKVRLELNFLCGRC